MGLSLTRRAARGLFFFAILLSSTLLLLALLLPYDHPWRLQARVQWKEASSRLTTPLTEQTWFLKHPKHPVHFEDDVGLIIRTGYGRGEHVLAQLQAMGYTGQEECIVIVGDAEEELQLNGNEIKVIDVIGPIIKDKQMDDVADSPRARRYEEIQQALGLGQDQEAKKLSESYSAALDAVKFLPALELAHQRSLSKKWWVMIDDDTLLLKTSLEKLLARLDPRKDQYIGAARGEGAYSMRFAYGQNAIILSQRALTHLFEKPDLVIGAKRNSLRDNNGDQLLAMALMKTGVYFDDRFTSFFNDLQPKYTRVTAENFCLPIATFHGFGSAENIITTGKMIHDYGEHKMVFNGAIWILSREPDITVFSKNPARPSHDHVGRLDIQPPEPGGVEAAETHTTDSAMDCVRKCDHDWDRCVAWSFDEGTKECVLASFVIVGKAVEGRFSGVHYARAKEIGDRCSEMMRKAGCFEIGADCGI